LAGRPRCRHAPDGSSRLRELTFAWVPGSQMHGLRADTLAPTAARFDLQSPARKRNDMETSAKSSDSYRALLARSQQEWIESAQEFPVVSVQRPASREVDLPSDSQNTPDALTLDWIASQEFPYRTVRQCDVVFPRNLGFGLKPCKWMTSRPPIARTLYPKSSAFAGQILGGKSRYHQDHSRAADSKILGAGPPAFAIQHQN
jgi:hypothetical protein